jgi:hypothetical protein
MALITPDLATVLALGLPANLVLTARTAEDGGTVFAALTQLSDDSSHMEAPILPAPEHVVTSSPRTEDLSAPECALGSLGSLESNVIVPDLPASYVARDETHVVMAGAGPEELAWSLEADDHACAMLAAGFTPSVTAVTTHAPNDVVNVPELAVYDASGWNVVQLVNVTVSVQIIALAAIAQWCARSLPQGVLPVRLFIDAEGCTWFCPANLLDWSATPGHRLYHAPEAKWLQWVRCWCEFSAMHLENLSDRYRGAVMSGRGQLPLLMHKPAFDNWLVTQWRQLLLLGKEAAQASLLDAIRLHQAGARIVTLDNRELDLMQCLGTPGAEAALLGSETCARYKLMELLTRTYAADSFESAARLRNGVDVRDCEGRLLGTTINLPVFYIYAELLYHLACQFPSMAQRAAHVIDGGAGWLLLPQGAAPQPCQSRFEPRALYDYRPYSIATRWLTSPYDHRCLARRP